MKRRKQFTVSFDHFMTSQEIAEAFVAIADANRHLTSCITSGQPDDVIKKAAKKLCELPSDPYHIAANVFFMMAKLTITEKEIGEK